VVWPDALVRIEADEVVTEEAGAVEQVGDQQQPEADAKERQRSGVERSPGIKDVDKITAFCKAARI
jgi:hypothetical protein